MRALVDSVDGWQGLFVTMMPSRVGVGARARFMEYGPRIR